MKFSKPRLYMYRSCWMCVGSGIYVVAPTLVDAYWKWRNYYYCR